MKLIAKSSVFALFLLLLFLVFALNIKDKLSIDMYAMLPDSDSKQALLKYTKINKTHEVILALKSETKNMDDYIQKIQNSFPSFTPIYPPQKKFIDFLEKYKFYLGTCIDAIPSENEVRERLIKLKENLRDGFLSFVDKDDPLLLFDNKNKQTLLMPNISNFSDVIYFTLDISSNEFEESYDKLMDIIKDDKDILVYSPFFYFVENSRIFKSQAKIILGVSITILAFLYLYWLKNLTLFVFTATTLFSSTLFSQIIASFFWNNISVYTLIFAGAISTVSVDYMFHYYLHDAYGDKKRFLKPVFYGFATSFLAFLSLFFVKFPLISQIALTSAMSLLFAYLSFAFIYPYMNIGNVKTKTIKFPNKNLLEHKYLLLLSIVIILLSPLWINFSFDLRTLDVKNSNLAKKEKLIFASLDTNDTTAIMISGKTLDDVIEKSKRVTNAYLPISKLISTNEYKQKYKQFNNLNFQELRENIKNISKSLGFKDGFFDNSYKNEFLFPKTIEYSQEFLDENNLKIEKLEGKYFATGYIDKNSIKNINEDIVPIDSILLFENELKKVAKELIYAGIFVFFLISIVIVYLTKFDFIRAFSFVTTPLAMCMLIFIFFDITILHVFMLIVIIAMSVDYGIYNACVAGDRTNMAICYSLLSTIAGFGVLSLSSIYSLQAIGIVALCGTITTASILYLAKVKN